MSRKVACSSCGTKGYGFEGAYTKNGTWIILCPKCWEYWKRRGLLK